MKIIGGVVALLLLLLYIQHLRTNIIQLTADKAVLSNSIQNQNDSIDNWKKTADTNWELYQGQIKEAADARASANKKASVIYQTVGKGCDDALNLVNSTK